MTFTVQTSTAPPRELTLTSTSYAATTVADARVIDHAGAKVAYLAFTSFLETSRAELDSAFVTFKQENVSELILDLRYNRGGRVNISNKLASLIVGAAARDRSYVTFALNNKYQNQNQSIAFTTEPQALNLSRVIVLTSASSCSASELVINGLRPFMDVVLVGQTTCGKPYGFLGRDACGKKMNAIEFEFVNDSNAGGYYNGITVDCAAADDLDHSLGDSEEGMLQEGLQYIENSSCLLVADQRGSSPKASPQPWPDNLPGISDLAN